MNLAASDPKHYNNDRKAYINIHSWLCRNFGRARRCEHCKKKKHFYQWALKHGCRYEKNINNFLQLCVSCHKKYDQTPGSRKNNSEGQKTADKSYCWKGVALLDPLTEEVIHTFPNVRGAAKQLQISHTAICLNLKGITLTAGGFKWKYATITLK
jgi:hypothetical protein